MSQFTVLLYYKYINIADPQKVVEEQRQVCKDLNLTGRIYIASEGINGTVEGKTEDTQKYEEYMSNHELFKDMPFKRSEGNGMCFVNLRVKNRKEIVSVNLGDKDIDPNKVTGKYLTADGLHALYESGEEFYIVDMRNDYEYKIGFFENSILPPLKNFRELPEIVENLKHLKDKKVVTVCTGGVRCEKASGFLVENGFTNVYQLKDGIHTYMEKYPNKHFKGKLYVFDGRIAVGFNVDSPEHEIVGKCDKCGNACDKYYDCSYLHCKNNRHFVCCDNCLEDNGLAFCSDECKMICLASEKPAIYDYEEVAQWKRSVSK